MATVGEFYDLIDAFAPFHTAMGFDNPGLLVGDRGTEVHSALFALDITPSSGHFSSIEEPFAGFRALSVGAIWGRRDLCPHQSGYGAGRSKYMPG